MKKSALYTGRGIVLLFVGISLAAVSSGASAIHQEGRFTAQGHQDKTWAVVNWIHSDANLYYCSYVGNIQAEVFDNWEPAFPYWTGTEWSNNCTTPDVVIKYYYSGDKCGSAAAVACIFYRQVLDSTRNSEYLVGGDIWLNEQHRNFTTSGKVATVNHEIGHMYGLDENYLPGGACNNASPPSIMDAAIGGDPVSGGCDGNYPTVYDWSWTSTEFYAVQAPSDPRHATPPTNCVLWAWRDNHWSESSYLVHYYYWNGNQWQFIRTDTHTTNVGPGRPGGFSELYRNFCRPSGWPVGWYTSCLQSKNYVQGNQFWVCTPNAYLF